jgi:hypothetical protein
MRKTVTSLSAALALSLAAWTAPAAAQDKAACVDAASKAQKLRSEHSLVEARAELRVCSSAACPTAVQADCTGWLTEVEGSLPTVVVSAKNRSGADLFDVKVSVDGAPLASKLDGHAAPMNPGPHAFHFETADGSALDQQVMVREGEKNQEVAVVLGALPASPPSPPPAGASPGSPLQSSPLPADSGAVQSSPWKTIGWVAGAAGIVGLGIGATFGVIALHDKNAAGCNAADVCQPGTTGGIKSAALVSDIGWIAGGVLLASGAALVLFAPGDHRAASAIRVAPSLVAGGGGAVLGGAW